jgi:hypothetical protein
MRGKLSNWNRQFKLFFWPVFRTQLRKESGMWPIKNSQNSLLTSEWFTAKDIHQFACGVVEITGPKPAFAAFALSGGDHDQNCSSIYADIVRCCCDRNHGIGAAERQRPVEILRLNLR